MSSAEDSLIVEQIEIGPMANFTYVIGSRTTREVALVDPAWDIEALLEHVEKQDLTPVAALITHYHPDHCGGEMMGQDIQGIAQLIARNPMKVHVHKSEAPGLKKITGVSDNDMVKVDSGDRLTIGEIEIEFLHTRGTPPARSVFASATPWSQEIPCSSRAVAESIYPAPIPTRCTRASNASPPFPTTPCCFPATTTATSRERRWGKPRLRTTISTCQTSQPGGA